MSTPANALNISQIGLVNFNGVNSFTGVTITQHDVLVGGASNAITSVSPSTSGLVLTSNGTSADPSFQSVSAAGAVTTITGNDSVAESPSAGNFNIVGTGSIITTGSSATETISLTGLTNHNVLVGAGTATITKVAPSATSGIPLVSNGSSADPSFTTAVVAGGGTGNTTFTAYSVVCAGTTATGAFQNVSGVGSSGNVLTSNGAGALPTWQAASSGGITTIDGDSGSATGSTVTFTSGSNNSGKTVNFSATGSTVTFNDTDASNNVAIGSGTVTGGFNSTTDNTFIGYHVCNASFNASDQGFNTGVGSQSLSSTGAHNLKGPNNCAFGYQALQVGNTISYNTCIGSLSGQSLGTASTCSYNTFLGYNSGTNITGFNSESSNIYINNGGNDSESNFLRIGAGTGTGTQQLNKAYISGINGNTAASTAVGVTSGDQLVAGGAINNSSQPAFSAYLGTSVTNATGNGASYTLGSTQALTKLFDQGSNFNTNGTFTAPVTGIYAFQAGTLLLNNITTIEGIINFTSSVSANTKSVRFDFSAGSTDNMGVNGSVLISMTAGDTLTVVIIASGNTGNTCTIQGAASNTWFSGYLVC